LEVQLLTQSLPSPEFSTNDQPLVSILINNYNYGCYLEDAIISALNQTYKNVEVVVVDDGSTDDSEAILANYHDRVTVIRKPNGGQASAFNAGFAASKGEIICFLDADDLFCANKVNRIVTLLNSDPALGWCFHPLEMMDNQTQTHLMPQLIANPAADPGVSGIYNLTQSMGRGKLNGCLPFAGTATSGICFRRSLLQQLLPMPEVIRITSDDYLKYAAMAMTPGYIILEKLTVQRIHGSNAYTHRPDKQVLYAQISVLTAYWLRQKLPTLHQFCNNLFASGINLYQGFHQISLADQPLVNQYLKATPRRSRWLIHLRVLYYRYRSQS
jgi:GT2 family glycosyltransferase